MAEQQWPQKPIATIWHHFGDGDVEFSESSTESFPGASLHALEIEILYRCKKPYGTWAYLQAEISTKENADWQVQHFDTVYFDLPANDYEWHEEKRTYILYEAQPLFQWRESSLEFMIKGRMQIGRHHNYSEWESNTYTANFSKANIREIMVKLDGLQLSFSEWYENSKKKLEKAKKKTKKKK